MVTRRRDGYRCAPDIINRCGRAVPAVPHAPQRTREIDGGAHKKKGRLRCHRRPKSREETPKEGSDSGVGLGGRYRISPAKTIAISGSIERKGSRTDTKVYGVRPQGRALPQWVPKQTCRPVGSMSPLPLPA